MGILDWFRSGEGGGSGDERDPDREVTPGGSVVYHYGREATRAQGGILAEEAADFLARREAVYKEMFGEPTAVYHEVVPLVPHVDVYIYGPREGRNFYTLLTGGMSDLPMTAPPQVGSEGRRAELILYVKEPEPDYASLLRFLAHFPHDNHTWFGHGHTMPNGQPPAPLFPASNLDTFLLLMPRREPDASLRERLTIGGDPVNPIWVAPITSAECQYKLDRGMDALLDLFDREAFPTVLDERRRSLV